MADAGAPLTLEGGWCRPEGGYGYDLEGTDDEEPNLPGEGFAVVTVDPSTGAVDPDGSGVIALSDSTAAAPHLIQWQQTSGTLDETGGTVEISGDINDPGLTGTLEITC